MTHTFLYLFFIFVCIIFVLHTLIDHVRNDNIRERLKVESITDRWRAGRRD